MSEHGKNNMQNTVKSSCRKRAGFINMGTARSTMRQIILETTGKKRLSSEEANKIEAFVRREKDITISKLQAEARRITGKIDINEARIRMKKILDDFYGIPPDLGKSLYVWDVRNKFPELTRDEMNDYFRILRKENFVMFMESNDPRETAKYHKINLDDMFVEPSPFGHSLKSYFYVVMPYPKR